MEKFCISLREHATNAINFEKKNMLSLTEKELKSHKIPVVFHSGSNYDYHFITKELANDFKGRFKYLRENTEKSKIFPVSIEKEIRKVDKDGHENITTVSYKIM